MRTTATVVLLISGGCLLAQDPSALPAPKSRTDVAPPPSAKFPAEWYAAQDPYHPVPDGVTSMTAPVLGAPYTGTMVMSYEGKTAGPRGQTTIVSRSRVVQMRDSSGRSREEEMFPPEIEGAPASTMPPFRQIEVNDPVTHCSFRWVEPATTEADKTATARCIHAVIFVSDQTDEADATRQAAENVHPFPWQTVQVEPLGAKVIGGVKAFGTRRTIISDSHNDTTQPKVAEVWYSPEIKEMVIMKAIGNNPGTPSFELTDIKRQEPDPALFYPPAGYKIVPEVQSSK